MRILFPKHFDFLEDLGLFFGGLSWTLVDFGGFWWILVDFGGFWWISGMVDGVCNWGMLPNALKRWIPASGVGEGWDQRDAGLLRCRGLVDLL